MRGDRKKEDTSRVHGAAGSTLGGAVAGAVMGTAVGTPAVGTIIGAVSGAVIGARKKRVQTSRKSKGIDEKKRPAAKPSPSKPKSSPKRRTVAASKNSKPN